MKIEVFHYIVHVYLSFALRVVVASEASGHLLFCPAAKLVLLSAGILAVISLLDSGWQHPYKNGMSEVRLYILVTLKIFF